MAGPKIFWKCSNQVALRKPDVVALSPAAEQRLRKNLEAIEARIARACDEAARPRDDVKLVAVTKYTSAEIAAGIVALGYLDLGEARPQQLWEKHDQLAPQSVRWHLIGQLQRNKIRRTLPLAHLIHSGESMKLLESIDDEAARAAIRSRVLLEVNLSGDATKHGFRAEELPALAESLAQLKHLEICGLMTMAALDGTLDDAQHVFANLRTLRDELQSRAGNALSLHELSMGMSDDFERAILEGATLIRVGSALVEGLDGG